MRFADESLVTWSEDSISTPWSAMIKARLMVSQSKSADYFSILVPWQVNILVSTLQVNPTIDTNQYQLR